MLTVSDEEDDLFEAIKAGANGYLLKEIPADEVATAVQAVAQGDSLISPSMASKLLREFNSLAELAAETGASPRRRSAPADRKQRTSRQASAAPADRPRARGADPRGARV